MPDLPAKLAAEVQDANTVIGVILKGMRVLRAGERSGEVALEHPAGSLLLEVEKVKEVSTEVGGRRLIFDMCAFGSPCRQRTAVLTSSRRVARFALYRSSSRRMAR